MNPLTISTPANTVSVDLAATSVTVALPTNPYAGSRTVRVTNNDQAAAFIEFGTSVSVAAEVANGHPILTKQTQDFVIGPAITHMAAIGTGTPNGDVYVTTGAD